MLISPSRKNVVTTEKEVTVWYRRRAPRTETQEKTGNHVFRSLLFFFIAILLIECKNMEEAVSSSNASNPKRFISADTLQEYSEKLAYQVALSGYSPTFVVALWYVFFEDIQ